MAKAISKPSGKSALSRRRGDGRREWDRRFRVLADHAPIGIFMGDIHGNCTYLNRQGAALYGMPMAKELALEAWPRVVHPDDQERVLAEWRDCAAALKSFLSVYRILRPDGTLIWVEAQAVPFYDDAGRHDGWISTVKDITAARVAETELEETLQSLHDTCIQSIYSIGLNLASSRLLAFEAPAEASQRTARAIADLNLVIQDLRGFISRNSVAHPDRPPGLREEIERTIPPDAATAFSIEIDAAVEDGLSPEQSAQLVQVTHETISNILRHARAARAQIRLRAHAGNVVLTVADDGCGFDTLATARSASGLGLHHIEARARKLGGSARTESSPGRGTVIELVFPQRRPVRKRV